MLRVTDVQEIVEIRWQGLSIRAISRLTGYHPHDDHKESWCVACPGRCTLIKRMERRARIGAAKWPVAESSLPTQAPQSR